MLIFQLGFFSKCSPSLRGCKLACTDPFWMIFFVCLFERYSSLEYVCNFYFFYFQFGWQLRAENPSRKMKKVKIAVCFWVDKVGGKVAQTFLRTHLDGVDRRKSIECIFFEIATSFGKLPAFHFGVFFWKTTFYWKVSMWKTHKCSYWTNRVQTGFFFFFDKILLS